MSNQPQKTEEMKPILVPSPGPWEYVVNNGWQMIYSSARDEDGERIPVADLFHGGFDHPELGYPLEANGKLMAAAPELLQICVEFCAKVDRGEARSAATYAKMKAAIAKATAQ